MIAFIIAGIIFILIIVVIIKVLVKKKRPTNSYTPYDAITGQEHSEFHEEREEYVQKEDERQGDDKDR